MTGVSCSCKKWWMAGLVALLVVGITAGMVWSADGLKTTALSPAAEKGQNYAKTLSKAFREAADAVLPSVVMIRTTPKAAKVQNLLPDDEDDDLSPFGDLFRRNPELRRFFREMPALPRGIPEFRAGGIGSGVVIDPSGIVLTNNHVVEGAEKIVVRLMDGREFKVSEVRRDPNSDLAIIFLENADKLTAAKLGDSDAIEVGDWVLALGDPFGLEGTVTAGIISAKSRGLGITPRDNLLQTDAAINPGNSGGPLVNLDGEVVGINTAIHSRSGGNQGVGFAVPINTAKWVAEQLRKHGKVVRAYLGVVIQPVTHELAEQFGVAARQGVLVTDVQPDSPAAKAGLKAGDIIVEYAGRAVARPQELQSIVERSAVGSKQQVTVWRDGKRQQLAITPAPLPDEKALASGGKAESGSPEAATFDRLGIEVETLTPQVAEQLGVKADKGVVITSVRPGGLAAMAGLTPGAVIVEANRKPVASVDEFRKAVESQPLEKGLLLLLRTAQGSRFVVLQADK